MEKQSRKEPNEAQPVVEFEKLQEAVQDILNTLKNHETIIAIPSLKEVSLV